MKARLVWLAVLFLFPSAGTSLAATINLLDLSQWRIYGTGGLQGGTLTIGDNVGYDRADSDRDGNPYNVWWGGSAGVDQGVDYDEAVTVAEFTPPLKLSWTGCFPSTRYGYNNIFIGRKNPSFTGAPSSRQYLITQEFGVTARWDYSGLNTVVLNAGNYDVQRIAAATLSSSSYCGNYRVEWANDLIQFFYNGTKVREQRYAYVGPVSVVVRSFELPHTFTAITMESGIGQAQNPATSRGLGSIVGANISGSVLDPSTGQRTTLTTANTAVAGDVSYAYNQAGELIAHVSGSGASQGVAFRFEMDYDTATQQLSGTVADNNDRTPRPVVFTNTGGLAWQGRVQGAAGHSASGAALSYDVSLNIAVPAQAIYASQFPPNGRFTVDLARIEAVSIPISIPALGVNRTESTNIVTDGSFVASLVPGPQGFSITGTIEGAFRMDPPIQFTVAYTPLPGVNLSIPISIDATGRFSGALSGNTAQNNMRFIGEWSSVSSDGATAGGTLNMPIPIDPATGAVASSAQLAVAGSVTAPVAISGITLPAGLPTSVSTPLSFQVTVPLVFR